MCLWLGGGRGGAVKVESISFSRKIPKMLAMDCLPFSARRRKSYSWLIWQQNAIFALDDLVGKASEALPCGRIGYNS